MKVSTSTATTMLSIVFLLSTMPLNCNGWSIPSSSFVVPSSKWPSWRRQYEQRSNVKSSLVKLFSSMDSSSSSSSLPIQPPQVWSNGFSSRADLKESIQEATQQALEGLPLQTTLEGEETYTIDFCFISISSQYDGQVGNPSTCVIPTILDTIAKVHTKTTNTQRIQIQSILGCTTSTVLSSTSNPLYGTDEKPACFGIDAEATPAVSIIFAKLPEVQIQTFHVLSDDVPDDYTRMSHQTWTRSVGLQGFNPQQSADNLDSNNPPVFFVVPSPAFQNYLDPLLTGIQYYYPGVTTFGGIASTVSSLSRARLFKYNAKDPQGTTTFTDGCVGVAMTGDIKVKTLVAQGTKPVGGIYRIVSGNDCTIKAIMLDQLATEEANNAVESETTNDASSDDDDDDDNNSMTNTKNSIAAAAYAKAAIPKPPLAEANFLMRTLSDDDQSSMRRAILIGLERGGSMGRTPNELARLAEGKGHRFTVFQVASAGMKDGSITLPLGRVDIQPGTRLRFFVRESDFAKQEVQAIWTGYKKQVLEETLLRMNAKESSTTTAHAFQPAMCMLLTTLDRGSKFFRGKPGYETTAITQFIPSLPSLGGFSTNGIIGKLDDTELGEKDVMVHGSASTYVLIGSASPRPLYYGAKEAAARQATQESLSKAALEASTMSSSSISPTSPVTRTAAAATATPVRGTAPRTANGELQLKRREVHSGRALTVSSVEWSVAENTAIPTSTLEGYLWDKETEVDRFRERVPLSNLVSQCRLSMVDPTKPKPRDWVGPILRRWKEHSKLVLIPECKRQEPQLGSLHKRYDVSKLTTQFVKAGAVALSINSDAILFGGSLDDITMAREAATKAALDMTMDNNNNDDDHMSDDGIEVPPILASDLIIYPYQLYKLRLAGADAVVLMAGALSADKDLLYLTKIAASLQLQCLVVCTSKVQMEALLKLNPGSISGIILSNRDLEDFSLDKSGEQVLQLLKSDAMVQYRNHHGNSQLILVEGRVEPQNPGRVENEEEPEKNETATMTRTYSEKLQDAGVMGAIVFGTWPKTNPMSKTQVWESWMNGI